MGRTYAKLGQVSLELVVIIAPRVAWEIFLKYQLPIFDNDYAVDILIGIVVDAIGGRLDFLGFDPNFFQASRVPPIVRLFRYGVWLCGSAGRHIGPAHEKQE
jgi:hypothetical protein